MRRSMREQTQHTTSVADKVFDTAPPTYSLTTFRCAKAKTSFEQSQRSEKSAEFLSHQSPTAREEV